MIGSISRAFCCCWCFFVGPRDLAPPPPRPLLVRLDEDVVFGLEASSKLTGELVLKQLIASTLAGLLVEEAAAAAMLAA